jgi:hypothetical protein
MRLCSFAWWPCAWSMTTSSRRVCARAIPLGGSLHTRSRSCRASRARADPRFTKLASSRSLRQNESGCQRSSSPAQFALHGAAIGIGRRSAPHGRWPRSPSCRVASFVSIEWSAPDQLPPRPQLTGTPTRHRHDRLPPAQRRGRRRRHATREKRQHKRFGMPTSRAGPTCDPPAQSVTMSVRDYTSSLLPPIDTSVPSVTPSRGT